MRPFTLEKERKKQKHVFKLKLSKACKEVHLHVINIHCPHMPVIYLCNVTAEFFVIFWKTTFVILMLENNSSYLQNLSAIQKSTNHAVSSVSK